MTKHVLLALALSTAGIAQAQESELSVSAGVRAWHTQWDTFSYANVAGGGQVVTQSPAEGKLVLIPLLSVRYRGFLGSLSMYPSTDHHFLDGSTGTRKEFDLNLGYYVTPGVALTLGYKKLQQRDPQYTYELAGPVAGVSATAPLGQDVSLYGSFGLGRLKITGNSNVIFDGANYRLSELGVAYTLVPSSIARAVTFTAGYRTQVLSTQDALPGQDGRDLTQGLSFGVIATF